MKHYEIKIPVAVYGWEANVCVDVEAENYHEACEVLSKALTKLVEQYRSGKADDE